MSFLVPFLYTLLFGWIILKLRFFRESGLNPIARLALFCLKIATGILVVYIYTHYYSNPDTADILLYYHDGKVMSNALATSPADFFRMISGIGSSSQDLFDKYYNVMHRWERHHDSFFFNDTHTIIRFNAICNLFSFGYIHVNTVVMCFLSFSGLIALFKVMRPYFPKMENLLLIAVFLPPALLFWGSAILKEGLLVFSMGFFVYSFINLFVHKKKNISMMVLFCMSGAFFLINKGYVLFLILPPLIAFCLVGRFQLRFVFLTYLITHVILIVAGLVTARTLLNKDFVEEIITHQRNFINVARGGVFLERDSFFLRLSYTDMNRLERLNGDSVKIKTGSSYEYWVNGRMEDTNRVAHSTDTSVYQNVLNIEPARSAYYMPHLKYSLSSFLSYAPKAFLNVLLRPYFAEAENLYQKACALENIAYLLIIGFCLIFAKYRNVDTSILWLGVFFTLNLFLVIGFTTPVAGALVRYKAPALPFLLMALFSLLNVEKVRNIPLLGRILQK